MTWMHEDTHFILKSSNLRTYCETLPKSFGTSTRFAKCFQNRLEPPRALRNASKIVWNLCALREMLPKSFGTSARSAKRLQNRLELLRAPRNASKIVWNLHALRETLPKSFGTSTRFAKCFQNRLGPLSFRKTKRSLALGPSKPTTRAPQLADLNLT